MQNLNSQVELYVYVQSITDTLGGSTSNANITVGNASTNWEGFHIALD